MANGELVLNKEETIDIFVKAHSRQQIDESGIIPDITDIVTDYLALHDGPLDLNDAYAMADSAGINTKYIDELLSEFKPRVSIDQQIEDIKTFGAVPTSNIIENKYKSLILESLRQTYPSLELTIEGGGTVIFFTQISSKIEKKRHRIFSSKSVQEKQSTRWARMDLRSGGYVPGCFSLDIDVFDPLFLRGCGSTIEKINAAYGSKLQAYHLTHHYDPCPEKVIK